MKKFKSKKAGTTLVEIIVALAILAMIGVTVMDAFATSSKVNRSAKVVDNATIIATNVIQDFKKDPEGFIKERNLSSTDVDNKTDTNTITTYNGEKKYDYVWNETTNNVNNGYSVRYTIKEDKAYGRSAMYKPSSTIDDEDFALSKDITNYLVYIVDVPNYTDWAESEDYLLILFKGWTIEQYKDWISGGTSKLSYERWFKTYGSYNSRTDYEPYKNLPEKYYNYYAMTDLIRARSYAAVDQYFNLSDNHFVGYKTDDSGYSRAQYIHQYPSKSLKKQQCENGAVSIKIQDGDIDLNKHYDIQIVNDSSIDVNLYVAAKNQDKVDDMGDKINIDLASGVATSTLVNEKNTYSVNYDVTVEVIRNSDKKIMYTVSSKEKIER